MRRLSVRMGRNFSPARKVLSSTAPSWVRRSLVRTKAPPFPGLTCWKSRILKTVPSTSMWVPFLNWLVLITAPKPSRGRLRRRLSTWCPYEGLTRQSAGGRAAGLRYPGERLARMGDRLVPGDADDALSPGLEQRLTLGIVLLRELVVVPSRPVRLYDELLFRPAKVRDDLTAVDDERHVDVRVRQTAGEYEVQDDILQLAPGGRRATGDDLRQLGHTAAGAQASEHLHELP